MPTIVFPIADETLARLRAAAERDGVSPEEYLSRRVEALLESDKEPSFQAAAAHVLHKNAELYRRLS
ncbi:MAG: DNA-binding protein [Planctomycetia bacterium]